MERKYNRRVGGKRGRVQISRRIFDKLKVSGAVHTGVEVCKIDLELSRLVERPWLQLMCCAICLPRGRNFR